MALENLTLFVTVLVILNISQTTRTTPELSSTSPNYLTNGHVASKDFAYIGPLHGESSVEQNVSLRYPNYEFATMTEMPVYKDDL
ncbi:hypothetical protein TNCV_4170481 [Trichonephila clavipes]|nr:hypothetical protein TNCV_4170481 [Trichonephila clavipes]